MTKNELRNWIKRRLGYPMVRIELHDTQIDDCIHTARYEYIKWAAGNITQEATFALPLSAGIAEYDLPSGVTNIVKAKGYNTSVHGINTLFSVENYLYNKGILAFLDNLSGYTWLDYHIALEYMDLIDKYIPDYYNWRYNSIKNTVTIKPTPALDSFNVGYLIIHSYMLEGTDENTTEISEDIYNRVWDSVWVQKYSLAVAKQTLGLIRRKFANFTSIGNEGISLDGDALISEGKEEMEALEEKLKDGSETYHGWGIIVG